MGLRDHSGLQGLLTQAKRAAKRRAQRASTAHAVLIMVQSGSSAGALLGRCGVREGALLSALRVVDDEAASAFEVAFERAGKLARTAGACPSDVHLLIAIARDGRTAGARCLDKMGIGARRVHEEASALIDARPAASSARSRVRTTPPSIKPVGARAPTPPRPGRVHAAPPPPMPKAERPIRVDPPRPRKRAGRGRNRRQRPASACGPFELDEELFPTLVALGRNLSKLAIDGKIDPVVGRDAEVQQLLDVLARRRGNNPLLVGAPGVGKTAVVEGLAVELANDHEGAEPSARVLIEVTAGSLVSGTGVRGALADRMRRLRDEVRASKGRVLLFIDEIHAIVGGDGPDDLASELKAALARGELPCIGATTEAEYRRIFERDGALARRFSVVQVAEPSPEVALEVLTGVAARYEAHHGVVYEPEALNAAVELSVRFLTERHLPDKAIAVIDQAAARVRRRGGAVVTAASVAAVIAERARVPLERLLTQDAERLLELEQALSERIVGHIEATQRIADVLRKGAAGFRGKRPLGTFLLLGPTGVGKTEMAKAVAELVFPTGAMTRFDMSELSEAHSVARLIGSPPGYVGHEEGGQLTEAVRRRPYQLVLLDEVEKAHPDVLLALLPLLDEGRLTDSRGRTVDFTNTIIFMTTNLGGADVTAGGPIGFGAAAGVKASRGGQAVGAARAALPPELWNRIDEPLFFAPLGRDEVREIARRMLDRVAQTLEREHGLLLRVQDDAIDALIEAGGYDPQLGARPMARTIGRLVESPLASAILAGGYARGDRIELHGQADQVLLR